jgi:hypothetical protein
VKSTENHSAQNHLARVDDETEQVTVETHRQLVQDLARLHDSRLLLVERLERVVVALALTLDAETAAAERLARVQDVAGARRIGTRSSAEWSLLAQRYRDVIRALEAINDEVALDHGGGTR